MVKHYLYEHQVDMPKCSYNLVSVLSGLMLEKIYGLFPIRANGTICSIQESVLSGCPVITEWGSTVVFHW